MFGWEFQTDDAVTEEVSAPALYGFIDGGTTGGGAGVAGGINGGIGGGPDREPKVLFYVGVADVGAALKQAERLGGRRVLGPEGTPGALVVGRFTDPEGNLIGVAGER